MQPHRRPGSAGFDSIRRPVPPRPTQPYPAPRVVARPAATAPSRRPAPKRRGAKKLLVTAIFIGALILVGSLYSRKPHTATAVAVKAKFTKSQTVCLDPGHGGDDPGANNQDITERDINLVVALRVRQLLQTAGYRVFMTRTTNTPTLSNHDRYTYCNQQKTTILVSIHHNFFDDTSVDYDTTLYYKDSDLALATSILNATSPKLGVTNDGVTQFNDGVLSESNMPAALSEAFFLTNDSEYQLLSAADSTRLDDEAQGIATGIINYFTQPKPQPAAQAPASQSNLP